jgi:hypothetical protein
MTYDELAYVIMKSYDPHHHVQKLKRTFDVHPWLLGTMDKSLDYLEEEGEFSPCLETHWDGITEPQQFMIEPCSTDKDTGVGVCIKAADFSTHDWGPMMHPFRNLPKGKPQLNAARHVFSRWERDARNKMTGNRTSEDQAKKDFARSKEMICSQFGPITEMYSYQRKQWEKLFDELEEEQCLPAGPVECWFPESKAEVVEYLASIAKEKTSDELHSGMVYIFNPRTQSTNPLVQPTIYEPNPRTQPTNPLRMRKRIL